MTDIAFGRRAFLLLLLGAPVAAAAANRKGSKRVGGTNTHGKGSHYVGPHKAPAKPAKKTPRK